VATVIYVDGRGPHALGEEVMTSIGDWPLPSESDAPLPRVIRVGGFSCVWEALDDLQNGQDLGDVPEDPRATLTGTRSCKGMISTPPIT
jgi:hypothetical protein